MKALVRKIKKYLFLFFCFKKINFLERMAYRGNFWLFMVSVLLQAFFNLFFLKIIFGWVDQLQGWNYYQVLLIAGTVLILDGLMWMSFAYLYNLKYQIKTGMLDSVLTKPFDGQFLVSIQRGDLEDSVRIITGLGVLIFAISHLNLGFWSLGFNFFWYLVLVLSGWIILYSLALLFMCVSFWTIDTPMSFFLVESIVRSAQYPTEIFRNMTMRFVFTFFIPLAFLGTVPAKIFSSGFDFWWILGSTLTAGIFFSFSRWIWKKGLAKYSSASS